MGPPRAVLWIAAGPTVALLLWAGVLQAQKLVLEAQRAALERQAEQHQQAARVLASPELIVRRLLPRSGDPLMRADLYLDPVSGTGIVVARGLPRPAPGRAWHLWFARGDERFDAGQLQVDASGSGFSLIPVPADLAFYQLAWIAEEPAGRELPGPSWIVSAGL